MTTDTGVPTAPPRAIIADSRTPTAVDLSWQAPACLNTGGEISEYEYELIGVDDWARSYQNRGSTRDNRVNVSRREFISLLHRIVQIIQLTPFTTYKARVRAYTTKGPGPWSMEQIVRTKANNKPNAPNKLFIIETTSSEVQLMWYSPFPPGGEIDQYKVRIAFNFV